MAFSGLLIIISILCVATAFTMKGNQHSTKLHMTAWGVQKLGKSILDNSVVTVEHQEEDTTTRFKKIPVGSGADERKSILHKKDQIVYGEEKNALLSKIDKSFMQKNLLMGLQGDHWGDAEKMARINLGVAENLLPASLNSAGITTSNIQAGGLFEDEWDF